MNWRASFSRIASGLVAGALVGVAFVPLVAWAFSPFSGPLEAWRSASPGVHVFGMAFGVAVFVVVAWRIARGSSAAEQLRTARDAVLEGDNEA
jgi:uncharacterized membrane protein